MRKMAMRDMPFSSMTMEDDSATGRLPRKKAARSARLTPSLELVSTPAAVLSARHDT
jgi:hypothetical protein